MILKFKKIIDLDKGIVEVDDQEIINVANKQLEEPKKDYKILQISFKRSDKPEIRNVSDYGQSYIESLLNPHIGNFIHSVKRLSDSEIFTIGDLIDFNDLEKGAITKFEINNTTKRLLVFVRECSSYGTINEIRKVKQPLFTTEDGVDIYEGDKIYTVDSNFEIQKTFGGKDEINNAWFIKEKAEEYILLNKPCLSINEIKNHTNTYGKDVFEKLKKLVKSKL